MKKITRICTLALLLALAGPSVATPVDINRADAATLAAALSGVGESRARAIVDYRREHGPFRRVEDLKQVRGIGDHLLEINRSALTVGTIRTKR